MYTEFFGLREAPFNSTSDPRFFFPSPQHEEALACLVYSVQERKGLVVVTGDVGSGKSLVTHMLVHRLGNTAETAVLSISHLGGTDMLQGICREFQIPIDAGFNTMEVLASIEEYLLAVSAKDRGGVLIVDDAHALSETNFEQLRLISNLEVAEGKLLQIVLCGQQDRTAEYERQHFRQARSADGQDRFVDRGGSQGPRAQRRAGHRPCSRSEATTTCRRANRQYGIASGREPGRRGS